MNNQEQFTGLYSMSKTLRFELQPVGKTADTFKQWLESMKGNMIVDDEGVNMFAEDKKIKDAYIAIKPIMDKLHEQFIEMSLLSEEAKKIDFSEYLKEYQNKSVSEVQEKLLRKKISDTYKVAGDYFSEKISDAIGKE